MQQSQQVFNKNCSFQAFQSYNIRFEDYNQFWSFFFYDNHFSFENNFLYNNYEQWNNRSQNQNCVAKKSHQYSSSLSTSHSLLQIIFRNAERSLSEFYQNTNQPHYNSNIPKSQYQLNCSYSQNCQYQQYWSYCSLY